MFSCASKHLVYFLCQHAHTPHTHNLLKSCSLAQIARHINLCNLQSLLARPRPFAYSFNLAAKLVGSEFRGDVMCHRAFPSLLPAALLAICCLYEDVCGELLPSIQSAVFLSNAVLKSDEVF